MKLIRLRLKNFKGIKEFDLNAGGKSLCIYAENGVGKTTLVDAFMWLLFNKDNQDRANFEIKTLVNGEAVHNLEHSVEATIEADRKTIELKKIYKEKWTKKRGQVKAEFTGHETEYFIDEVPRKKKEFEDFINALCPEKIFRLVTNPLYFNLNLPWKERREIMLGICGDIGGSEVIAVDKGLEYLRELIDDKGTDDALLMLKAKKKKINDELKEIPIRISEVSNSLPELPQNVDFTEREQRMFVLENEILGLDNQAAALQETIEEDKKSGYECINDLQKELYSLRNKQSEEEASIKQQEQQNTNLLSLIEAKQSCVNKSKRDIEQFQKDIQTLTESTAKLRAEWHEVDRQQFGITEDDTHCKACGQELPEDMKAKKLQHLKAKFLQKKEEELFEIAGKGNKNNQAVEGFNKTIDNLKVNILTLESEIVEMQKSIKEPEPATNYLQPEIEAMEAEIKKAKDSLSKVNYGDGLQDLRLKKQVLAGELDAIKKTLSLQEVYEKNKERIEELTKQEEKLSGEFLQIEKQVFDVERFIQLRGELLEEKLNSMFVNVRFKLFDIQINSGVNPTFETLVKGVPFPDANGAGKINAGIEIINKLSEFYNFSGPLFVDNRESVINLQETKSQVIGLVVSEGDKQLRVTEGIDLEKEDALDLVEDYLQECRNEGPTDMRQVIHYVQGLRRGTNG
jgi:DNA repair protein SbcC/Rad50